MTKANNGFREVSPETIEKLINGPTEEQCKDSLFGEGKQGVKRSFQFFALSFMYFLTGILYMIKGFPTYFNNKFIKKKNPGIVVCDLPWEGQGGLDVKYHFPMIEKNRDRMLELAAGGLSRTNAKHTGITTVKTEKTYEDVMAEKKAEDDVYHFGTGADGKEIVS